MDYEYTFAPVAKMTTVPTLIAIYYILRWKIFQMDVKNTFLNSDPHEEVYMSPLPGISQHTCEVFWLRKTLYVLKQAPRAWLSSL